MIKNALILFFLLCFQNVFAQRAIDRRISTSFENQPLTKILYDLELSNGLTFYFVPEDMPSFLLSANFENEQVFAILQFLLNGTNLISLPYNEKVIVILNKEKASKDYLESIVQDWKNARYKYPINAEPKILSHRFGESSDSSKKVKLNLAVFASEKKEALIGAILTNNDQSIGAATDVQGNLELILPAGIHQLKLSYTGYQAVNLQLEIYENATLQIEMETQAYLFDAVEVVANSEEQKLSTVKAGLEVLDIKSLENIPQAMGEVDILKSLEIIPGVSSATELSQGFNVRGGSTDQNLVLLDEGIIFNPTHIVGFISAFNPDVISEAALYKGYVDASYGGRVSGILNLKSEIDKQEKWTGKGGLGTSMIKLSSKGPVGNKMDLQIAGRGSFNDYILRSIANVELQRSNANFFDLNANIRYELGANHKIYFNNYLSKDFFEYNDEFGFRWQNVSSGLKLNSSWGSDIYSEFSINYGSYNSENFTINTPDAFNFKTGLNYAKSIFSINKKWTEAGFVKIGCSYLLINNEADQLSPEGDSNINTATNQRNGSQNIAPFLSVSNKLGDKISFEIGLRLAMINSLGPGEIFEYENDIILENQITNSFELSGVDDQGSYQIFEPRFSINYQPKADWSIKSSYIRMSQNIFQLSATNSALPSDIWAVSNRYIKPSISDQISLGFLNLGKQRNYEFSLDLFYKRFSQLYELKDFASIILNKHLETDLLESKGRSYGAELLIKKNKGKWRGLIAYTFSRSFRQTIDSRASINAGKEFAAGFDIPHQLNVLASYKPLPVVSFNFAYIYRSGVPTTAPTSTIIQDGFLVPLYSDRNTERIPYYSRFDFSINLDMRKSKKEGFRSSFNLGFYNLLGRNNPTSIFYRRSSLGNIVPFQFSVIGSVVPNISWNFIF